MFVLRITSLHTVYVDILHEKWCKEVGSRSTPTQQILRSKYWITQTVRCWGWSPTIEYKAILKIPEKVNALKLHILLFFLFFASSSLVLFVFVARYRLVCKNGRTEWNMMKWWYQSARQLNFHIFFLLCHTVLWALITVGGLTGFRNIEYIVY